MRKVTKKTLSFALAMSMIATMVPTDGLHVAKVSAASNSKENVKILAGKELPDKKKETKKYEEGTALVMYRKTKASVSKMQLGTMFGGDIKVKNSIEINPSKKESVKAFGTTSKMGFEVALVHSDTLSTSELINTLKKRDDVLYAQPNYIRQIASTADYSSYLWGIENNGQLGGVAGTDVGVSKVDKTAYDKNEKVIAIIDTGVDYEHEDLQGVIWENPYQSQLKGAHGFDFANWDDDPKDDNGHGTHCAGIIAANDNQLGVKGVAAGTNVKIMPLKFLDSEGYGDTYAAISAYAYIYEAQKLGVNVVAVNDSWGGYMGDEGDDLLTEVINLVGENGAITVCAAGNENTDLDEDASTSPACLDSEYIISVAAANAKGERAEFSNYGKKYVDVAAPGADILSSLSDDTFCPSIYGNKSEICNNYFDFNQTFRQVDYDALADEKASTNSELVYAVDKAGDGIVTLEASSEEHIGSQAEDKGLKFSIKDAKEGETYTFAFPYNKAQTNTEAYKSFMVKCKGPQYSQERFVTEWDYYPTVVMISDSKVASSGAIEKETIGGVYITGDTNYWTQASYKEANRISARQAGKYIYEFEVQISDDGDYDIYVDDFADVKPGVKKESFGKYGFENGTSMASPYVAGCVAVERALYPKDTVLETKNRLLSTVKRLDQFKDITVSGGMVDVSNLAKPMPAITEVKEIVAEDSASASVATDAAIVAVNGVFFGENPTVTVNDKPVTLLSKTSEQVKFNAPYNEILKIKVTGTNGVAEQEAFITKGEETEISALTNGYNASSTLISDGDKVVEVYSDGSFWYYYPNDKSHEDTMPDFELKENVRPYEAAKFTTSVLGGIGYNVEDIFGEERKYAVMGTYNEIARPTFMAKELYSVLHVDFGFAEDLVLAHYNMVDGKWENTEVKLPDLYKNVEKASLVAYKNDLYLIGGYDKKEQKTISTVCKIDLTKKETQKIADMPEGKFNAKALVSKDTLLVTLGGNGEKKTKGSNSTFAFDGNAWKTMAAINGLNAETDDSVNIEYSDKLEEDDDLKITKITKSAERKLHFYDAAVGYTDEGLLYAGIKAEKLGNVFAFDLASNTYVSNNMKYVALTKDATVKGTTCDDKFYVFSGEEVVYDDYYWDDFSNGVSAKSQDVTEQELGYEKLELKGIGAFTTFDVENETVEVKAAKTYDEGYIVGTGKYHIGDIANLTVVPYPDYFAKSINVGTVKTVSQASIVVTESVSVKATFGKYVSSITNDTYGEIVEVEAGSKVSLKNKYEIYPIDADDKSVSWKTSNKKYATVDKNGKVTFTSDKKAVGKNVTITVTATDRGSVFCTWTYKIVEAGKFAVTKVKIIGAPKKLKAGKSTYLDVVVKPSNATNTKVKWKVNNKKYATINKYGKLTAKKAGIGKTVVVTVTSVQNPKISAKVKIKIVKK
ncbi:MAG: S8 family serine peptidase [Lachnospiraceae bacterium]|nr:S8 family serine peptidase [Lachnospiraceae bacterium]